MENIKKIIPNLLTCSRILLTPIIIWLGLTNHLNTLISLAILVALTDTLDGYLARKWQVSSELGAKLDAVADKILIIGLLVILIIRNHSFFYVLILECIIAFFNLFFYLKRGITNSLMIGKIKTWIIFITIIIGLFDIIFTHWNIPINYFVYFTVLWQICSLFSYIKYYFDMKIKKKRIIEEYEEYVEIVKPILESMEFCKRREYNHHVNESVYEHTLKVSFDAYKIAKKFHWDYESAAIGGLLHDFYDTPWQFKKTKTKFLKKHGFIHAEQARQNALKHFPELMNPKVEDIIKKHMFPLNRKLPKYKESWLITFIDKADSIDFLLHPRAILKIILKKEIKKEEKYHFLKYIKKSFKK